MTKIQAAVVQAAPIPLNITAGIEAAVEHVDRAATQGAQVIAFGETFLGGYPLWLDEAPGAALWDHPGTRALHRILLEQAVREDDERLATLQDAADRHKAVVSIAAHQRIRNSLYNAQLTFAPGRPVLTHRKLVPTHGERLIWARGDGATMEVLDQPWGRVGGLICWEHWMPLARAAMHHQGETVHVAQWPTVQESYMLAARHYAFEGRCFVLSAGTVLHRQDLIDGLAGLGGHPEAEALLMEIPDKQLQSGGSAIIAPDAKVLAGPIFDQGAILEAELDLDQISENLTSLDSDGHYSRPDIFELRMDRRPQKGVVFD